MNHAEVKLVQNTYGRVFGLHPGIFDDHITFGIVDDYEDETQYDYDTNNLRF